MPSRIAFIGAGNMAEAIARCILHTNRARAEEIIAVDVSAARRELFASEFSARTTENAAEAINGESTVVFLCVKPQQVGNALQAIAPSFPPSAILISIAAGISTAFIESKLASSKTPQPRVVRVMPNTPMLVGAGAAAIASGAFATLEDLNVAKNLFESSAKVVIVDEAKLDAVTAVSGSGPAYFFYLVELMSAAGIANGLTAEESAVLARQTAIGAGEMFAKSLDSPEVLRSKVTSPGGTTHAAIERMKALKLDALILDALTAAANRAGELSREAK